MKTNESDILTVLSFISDNDMEGDVSWRCDGDRAPITFWINCNDTFAWGCSDGEHFSVGDLPDIKRAMEDCENAIKHYSHYGVILWIARARKMRPQGAAYPQKKELHALFDAVGPVREVGLGNPYEPGKRKKYVSYEFASKIEKLCRKFVAVSYTHLTLPTKRIV